MRIGLTLIAIYAFFALAACRGAGFSPPPTQTALTLPPLLSAPVDDIESTQLPPAADNNFRDFRDFRQTPASPGPHDEKMRALAALAPDIAHEDMLGRWTMSTGDRRCDLFLALTAWSGGYRAASRGCAGQAALVSSWNVTGKQVVLKDRDGTRLAGFYQSGEQRFDGATALGQTASLER